MLLLGVGVILLGSLIYTVLVVTVLVSNKTKTKMLLCAQQQQQQTRLAWGEIRGAIGGGIGGARSTSTTISTAGEPVPVPRASGTGTVISKIAAAASTATSNKGTGGRWIGVERDGLSSSSNGGGGDGCSNSLEAMAKASWLAASAIGRLARRNSAVSHGSSSGDDNGLEMDDLASMGELEGGRTADSSSATNYVGDSDSRQQEKKLFNDLFKQARRRQTRVKRSKVLKPTNASYECAVVCYYQLLSSRSKQRAMELFCFHVVFVVTSGSCNHVTTYYYLG